MKQVFETYNLVGQSLRNIRVLGEVVRSGQQTLDRLRYCKKESSGE